MQGSSLPLCSNVMFLHNKCPNRPPYPPRPLHFSFQHYLILLRCALFCIYIEKCVLSATTFLVQKVSPVTVLALKRSSTVQTSQACTVLWWQPDERGGSQFSLSHKSRWQRAQRGKVSVQDSVGLHFKYKPKEYQHKKDTTLQMALKVVTGWYPPTGNPCPIGVPNDWHSGGTYEDTLSNKTFNWFPRESISTKPLLYQLVNSGTPAQVR